MIHLRRYDIPLDGARVAVVGRGVTISRPIGLLLTRRSENATVTLCHTGTRDLAAEVSRADLSSSPRRESGTPDHRRHDQAGAAVIDVGVSRNEQDSSVTSPPDVWDNGRGPSRPIPVGLGR